MAAAKPKGLQKREAKKRQKLTGGNGLSHVDSRCRWVDEETDRDAFILHLDAKFDMLKREKQIGEYQIWVC